MSGDVDVWGCTGRGAGAECDLEGSVTVGGRAGKEVDLGSLPVCSLGAGMAAPSPPEKACLAASTPIEAFGDVEERSRPSSVGSGDIIDRGTEDELGPSLAASMSEDMVSDDVAEFGGDRVMTLQAARAMRKSEIRMR